MHALARQVPLVVYVPKDLPDRCDARPPANPHLRHREGAPPATVTIILRIASAYEESTRGPAQGTAEDMEKTLLDSLEVFDVALRQDEREAMLHPLVRVGEFFRKFAGQNNIVK